MKVNDIINLDVEELLKMNKDDLTSAIKSAHKIAAGRITRMEKSGNKSVPIKNLKEHGNFEYEGMNTNQLRGELTRAKNFLNTKTSTITGLKKVKRDLFKCVGGELTQSQEDILWETYNKMVETNKALLYGKNSASDQLQKFLRNEIVEKENNDGESLVEKSQKLLDEIYLEQQAKLFTNDIKIEKFNEI